jgi:hypothetical protein
MGFVVTYTRVLAGSLLWLMGAFFLFVAISLFKADCSVPSLLVPGSVGLVFILVGFSFFPRKRASSLTAMLPDAIDDDWLDCPAESVTPATADNPADRVIQDPDRSNGRAALSK